MSQTEHLPECPLLEPCDDEVPEHGYCSMQRGVFCIHCHQWCICDRLAICELRIATASCTDCEDQGWNAGYEAGFEEALNQAEGLLEFAISEIQVMRTVSTT